MSFLFSRRGANLLAAIACIVLIAIAYFYMENYLFLVPCPLCYAQRFAFGFLAFFFLLAAIFPGGRVAGKIHGIWLFLLACGGAALSIRHLYLQNLPKGTVTNCGQDFYALVESTPVGEVVKTMVFGTGECGEIQWTMFGLSIPGWTLIAFIALGVWGLFHNAFRAR